MSDQEIVTFNRDQFARVDLLLATIGNTLWNINEQLKPIDNAINRLADVSNSEVNAKLDKIISLLEADPEALKLLAAKLKSSTDALDAAVKNQTTKP